MGILKTFRLLEGMILPVLKWFGTILEGQPAVAEKGISPMDQATWATDCAFQMGGQEIKAAPSVPMWLPVGPTNPSTMAVRKVN